MLRAWMRGSGFGSKSEAVVGEGLNGVSREPKLDSRGKV